MVTNTNAVTGDGKRNNDVLKTSREFNFKTNHPGHHAVASNGSIRIPTLQYTNALPGFNVKLKKKKKSFRDEEG